VPGAIIRHDVPALRAEVCAAAGAGRWRLCFATVGLHWQESAIWLLLDLQLDNRSDHVVHPNNDSDNPNA
jgi:hypothetical protein